MDPAGGWHGWIPASLKARGGLSHCAPVELCEACVHEADGQGYPTSIGPGREWSSPETAAHEVALLGQGQPPTRIRGSRTYSIAPTQPLLGVPLREGLLWHLSRQDHFRSVMFSLYVNGFAFSPVDEPESSVSLSPFSLVRNCRFQSGMCSRLKTFRVSLLDNPPCYYFAVGSSTEREADRERSAWVLGISHTILLIIDSLLPPVPATCDPLPGAPQTARRLLAGYLIHKDDSNSLSVPFCELQAHNGASARIVMYEDDTCAVELSHIYITEGSMCCDVVGINCSCFIVDTHHFAAQTPMERKIWLRAVSNIRIKVENRAPEPTDEELEQYRFSIREHLAALDLAPESRIAAGGPMLSRSDVDETDDASLEDVQVRASRTSLVTL